MKNKNDSSVAFLYNIGKVDLLSYHFRKQISYSTITSWRKTDYSKYLGHEFRSFFNQAFTSAELKFKYYYLKETMMSLARSWVTLSHILVSMVKNAAGNKQSQGSILNAVNYMRNHLGLERALKLMGLSKNPLLSMDFGSPFRVF